MDVIQPLSHNIGPLPAGFDLDACCIFKEQPFKTLITKHLNHSPPVPYVTALVKNQFGSLTYYDAYTVHKDFSEVLKTCKKVDYYVINTIKEGFIPLIQPQKELILGCVVCAETKNVRQKLERCCIQDPALSFEKHIEEILQHMRVKKFEETSVKTVLENILKIGDGFPNNPKELYELLLKVIASSPKNSVALGRIGELLRIGFKEITKAPAKAKFYFEEAITSNSEDAFSHARLGLMHYEKDGIAQDLKNAEKHLRVALNIDPGHFAALKGLALLLFDKGEDAKEIFSLCQKAHALKPQDETILTCLIDLHPTVGLGLKSSHKTLKHWCELLLTTRPKSTFAMARLAELLRHGGQEVPQEVPQDVPLAKQLFEEALQLNPNDPFILGRLGAIFALSDPIKAFKHISRALLKSSHDSFANAQLAYLYCVGPSPFPQDPIAAKQFATEALKENKNNALALAILGKIDEKEGWKSIEKAFKLDPFDPFVQECLIAIKPDAVDHLKTDRQRQFELLQISLTENPDDLYTLIALGEWHSESITPIEKQKADDYFERAYLLDSNYLPALVHIAEKKSLNDKPGAIKLFRRAHGLSPENPIILTRLGCLLGESKQHRKEAKNYLEKALELQPNDGAYFALAIFALAMIFIHGGDGVNKDLPRAKNLLERAIQQLPTFTQAHAELGNLLLLGGTGVDKNHEEAKKHFDKALLSDPDNKLANEGIGQVEVFEEIALN